MNGTGRFSLTLALAALTLVLDPGMRVKTLTAQPVLPQQRPGKVYIKHDLNQGKAALGFVTEEPVAGPARDAVLRARVPILRDAKPSPRRHVDPGALYQRRLAMYGESAAFDKGLPRTASEEGDPDGGSRPPLSIGEHDPGGLLGLSLGVLRDPGGHHHRPGACRPVGRYPAPPSVVRVEGYDRVGPVLFPVSESVSGSGSQSLSQSLTRTLAGSPRSCPIVRSGHDHDPAHPHPHTNPNLHPAGTITFLTVEKKLRKTRKGAQSRTVLHSHSHGSLEDWRARPTSSPTSPHLLRPHDHAHPIPHANSHGLSRAP